MNEVYLWIQQNYSDKTQLERDYIFLRMMGDFNYGEDGIIDDFKWDQTAGEPIYVKEGVTEMSYYVDKIGLTEAEYKYLRYKVRIQNVLAVGSESMKWEEIIKENNKENFDVYKTKFEDATGLEFNEKNWMAQYNSMSGHGDFAHQMITMATLFSESGWIADLYTGGEEMTDHNSGWFGDVTLNGQLGNDDYCADLDAVNIAAMIEDGQSYIDAMNKYYSEVGTEYTRAEKFIENIPLEKIESMLIEYYYAECQEGTLTVDGLKQISEKAYNFIKNIQENNNTLIKYEE